MNEYMKDFFDDIEVDIERYPYQLAQEFLSYLYDTPESFLDVQNAEVISVPDNYSLERVSKRGLVFSERIAIVQQAKTPIMFSQRFYSSEVERNYIYISSLEKLGKWIWSARNLLIDGKITYIPNGYSDQEKDSQSELFVIGRDIDDNEKRILSEYMGWDQNFSYIHSYSGKPINDNTERIKFTPDSIYDSAKMKALELIGTEKSMIFCSDRLLNKDLMKRIFSISIPSFDEVPLDKFADILDENEVYFQRFSDYMKKLSLEIDNLDQNKIDRISLDIKKQTQDLSQAIIKSYRSFFMKTGMITLSTFTATLLLSNIDMLNILAAILGTSSTGIAAQLKNLLDFFNEQDDIEMNPAYFLWLLGKRK